LCALVGKINDLTLPTCTVQLWRQENYEHKKINTILDQAVLKYIQKFANIVFKHSFCIQMKTRKSQLVWWLGMRAEGQGNVDEILGKYVKCLSSPKLSVRPWSPSSLLLNKRPVDVSPGVKWRKRQADLSSLCLPCLGTRSITRLSLHHMTSYLAKGNFTTHTKLNNSIRRANTLSLFSEM